MLKVKELNPKSENLESVLRKHFKPEIAFSDEGVVLNLIPGNLLKVEKLDNEINIEYSKKVEIFRGISIALENSKKESYSVVNRACFENLTFMLDCSRNAVINFENFKKLVKMLAMMGFNGIQLYTEDTYKIESEPYFGHLRGRFTGAEIKVMEEYAEQFGIELIPCIQTLAHLDNIFLWPRFEQILDIANIVDVSLPETYEFIEKMFATIHKNFKTRKVNLGMDEAHYLGLGRYLDRNGYRPKLDIFIDHLHKVSEIAKKYGFKCSIWSDMIFRIAYNEYYPTDTEPKVDMSRLNNLPEDFELIFWDYYHTDESIYDEMYKRHFRFKNKIQFAGGAWKWLGFAPMNEYGLKRAIPALKSAHKHNIKDVLLTAWGDNGNEASVYSVLPQIITYAEYCYTQNYDEEYLAKRLKVCSNANYSDFIALDLPNQIDRDYALENLCNPCKYLFYNDPLCGLFDYHVKASFKEHFSKTARVLEECGQRNPDYEYIFRMEASLCDYLAVKANLGNELAEAYKRKDNAELKRLIDEVLPLCFEKLNAFAAALRNLWYTDNKTFGFDVLQLRIGGQRERLKEVIMRVGEYLEGKIDRIEEFEQPKLSFADNYLNGSEDMFVYKHNYRYMATPHFN